MSSNTNIKQIKAQILQARQSGDHQTEAKLMAQLQNLDRVAPKTVEQAIADGAL